MNQFIKSNGFLILSGIIGAGLGFLYWRTIGCNSGQCFISSSPINSSIYGAIMGWLLYSSFSSKKI
ncbi:MAG TPA: hypothetical protein PK006_03005 [Saprospiraceae bacterium]|nr:hypothetical protein [Saprospiraceae bacterium]